MHNQLRITLLSSAVLFAQPLFAQSKIESDLTQLQEQKDKALAVAIEPINRKYRVALEKLLLSATKSGDLQTANRIVLELKKAKSKERGEKLIIKIEGEDIEKVTVTAGVFEKQPMQVFGQQWSSHRQLLWYSANPSDNLKATLPVEKAGTYQINAQFTKANDYGIFEIYLNGEKIEDSIDFYNNRVDATGTINFGQHELKTGNNEFKFIIIGANPTAVQKFMFGLDYIELVQQD